MKPAATHRVHIGFLVLSTLVSIVNGRPDGAPASACDNMRPNHGFGGQTSNPPYEIIVSGTTYGNAGDQITVTIKVLDDCDDSIKFRGFLLQARRADPDLDNDERLGTFAPAIAGTGKDNCGPPGILRSMTHMNRDEKLSLSFIWTAPDPATDGHIQFIATIVQKKDTWWHKIKSRVVYSTSFGDQLSVAEETLLTNSSCPAITTPPTGSTPTPVMAKIQKDGDCGSTKGCFSHCKAPDDCEYLATWVPRPDYIDFTLKRKIHEGNNVWIAIGFSKDTTMSDDSTVACILSQGTVMVISGYNEPHEEEMEPLGDMLFGLNQTSGSLVDGVFTCSFTRQKSVDVTATGRRRKRDEEEFPSDNKHFFDLSNQYFLFFGDGPAEGADHVEEHEEIPAISASLVDFTSTNDYTEAANMLLPVAHGCLMIIAWLFLACIGLVLPPYYKPVWSSSKLCKEKVWFQCHRFLMILTFLSCTVAFVLIFVFNRAYSYIDQSEDKFKKSHSIIGIIVMSLALINPIMAFFRCHPGEKHRPIFNWCHRIVGVVALGLGFVNIISGLSLRKGELEPPDFLPYIVYAHIGWYVLFHIILTIYDCVNRKRDCDYEVEMTDMSKGPPEPTPTQDSMFKKLMLAIHIPVVTALSVVVLYFVITGEMEGEDED